MCGTGLGADRLSLQAAVLRVGGSIKDALQELADTEIAISRCPAAASYGLLLRRSSAESSHISFPNIFIHFGY